MIPLDINKPMYYVYILQNEKSGNFYTGFTGDLKRRFAEHRDGLNKSTANKGRLTLVYFESCLNKKDAIHREKYLKTARGKRYIKARLKNYLTGEKEGLIKQVGTDGPKVYYKKV
jgi:putative endonuclease